MMLGELLVTSVSFLRVFLFSSYPFGVPPTKPGSCAIPMDHYPDRVCKDIPFKAYFYKQQSSPSTYLKFLKDLENSTSRLDFLFWLFDILCSGNPKSSFQEAVLNEVYVEINIRKLFLYSNDF